MIHKTPEATFEKTLKIIWEGVWKKKKKTYFVVCKFRGPVNIAEFAPTAFVGELGCCGSIGGGFV